MVKKVDVITTLKKQFEEEIEEVREKRKEETIKYKEEKDNVQKETCQQNYKYCGKISYN